jgi:acetoin utilization deacetylase AcuC-like enzyme
MRIVYHEDYLKQTQNDGHPECPERLSAIMSYVEQNSIEAPVIVPEPAETADVLAIHSSCYMELLKNFGRGRLDMDTSVWPHTYEMAMMAAGGGIAAVRNMLERREPTFALVRPPGHHATREMGMGFCYINNVAVAANWLRKKVDRVAIVDIDVHHGNGTNDTFLDRSDVLYISTHEWGIYPGTGPAVQTGTGKGEGYTVNIPVGGQSGDATFRAATDKIILPVLREFKPDAILVSLGGDAHYMDPLSSLTLSSKGYLGIVADIAGLAGEICENRWAAFLEGGYNILALADVVGASMAMASGDSPETCFNEISDTETVGADWVSEAREIQKKYWKL